MPVLYAITLFVSATLLFLIQPMVAKMILPRFGGAPAVWNTCMVFYQALLLLGYLYAHASTTWLGVKRQAVLHLALLLLPVLSLPIAVADGWSAPPEANPIPWVLGLLAISVGLPFFVVSSSAPLLQKWFSSTGHPSAQDPYYLYAASNLGSMIALLGYPFLIEPTLRLRSQGWMWAVGYVALVALTYGCAVALWRYRPPPVPELKVRARKKGQAAERAKPVQPVYATTTPGKWTRLRWVVLAFLPSSWMLGVTTYLTTDISPFPLLWVIPLALYLLTFILVFSRLPAWVHRAMCWALPPVVLLQVFLMVTGFSHRLAVVVPVHLLTFFVATMVCHGELARTRPPTQYLTEFYLWLSLGGVLGGLFNGLVAPMVFNSIAEYPLVIVFTCLLMPPLLPDRKYEWSRVLDVVLPVLLGLFAYRFLFQWEQDSSQPFLEWLGTHFKTGGGGLARTGPQIHTVRNFIQWGVPIVACLLFLGRPLRFGLGVGAIFLASAMFTLNEVNYVHQERSFFGLLRIESLNDGGLAKLSHGVTLHGAQFRSEHPQLRMMPLLYYFPNGPIGQIFSMLYGRGEDWRPPIAAVGLGSGTLAAYALPATTGKPPQEITFFDIDPAVVRIAQNFDYFTYLTECPGVVRVVLGDARLSLEREPNGRYGIIIVDAFSSDAIPVHLITQEAIRLYKEKLTPEGILAIHISNKYLNLEPAIANLAKAENLACLVQRESEKGSVDAETRRGKLISDWMILARDPSHFGELGRDPRWRAPVVNPNMPLWTDDFSNVLSVMHWWI
jgi:hypothetical protein